MRMADDRYVCPHEIDLKFAAEEGADLTGRVNHLFVAGPFARLNVVPESGPRPEIEVWATMMREFDARHVVRNRTEKRSGVFCKCEARCNPQSKPVGPS
jgi:hypothetical protein